MAIKTRNPINFTPFYKRHFTPPDEDLVMETFMTIPTAKLAIKNLTPS